MADRLEVEKPEIEMDPMILAGAKSAAKVSGIWATVEHLVREGIAAAEKNINAPGAGAEKKAWVKEWILNFLKDWEAQQDVIPGIVEPMVFKAIGWALDHMIERVLTAMRKAGEIHTV